MSCCARWPRACRWPNRRSARNEKCHLRVYHQSMTTNHLAHDPTLHHPEHPDWPARRSVAMRYGVAVLAVIVAFALRYAMQDNLNNRLPFIFFVPAAMIAAWYGGMAPGLLAAAAGLLLADYFFLSSHEALGPVREGERIGIGLYAVTTTLVVMLFENLHNRIRRLEHALERARHHHHPKPHPEGPASPPEAAPASPPDAAAR